jgi:hypothetical protein
MDRRSEANNRCRSENFLKEDNREDIHENEREKSREG